MFRTMPLALLALALSAAPAAAQAAAARTPAAQAPAAPAATGAALNLNTATEAQLEALPGIGKATAERIIEYRQKNGGFKKPEDLMNIKGIGEKSFLKLKPMVTVTAPKAAPAAQ